MSAPLEIACPLSEPIHFASYDVENETVSCPVCGPMSTAELCARVEAEWSSIDVHPPLAEDERAAVAVAARLFAAFPDDPEFAVKLAVSWGVHALGGRLPEEHLLRCVELAVDRVAA